MRIPRFTADVLAHWGRRRLHRTPWVSKVDIAERRATVANRLCPDKRPMLLFQWELGWARDLQPSVALRSRVWRFRLGCL